MDEASSVFNKIQASMGILGNTLSQMGGAFGSAGSIISGFAGGGVMGGLAAGIGEISKGLSWAVGEAKASEQSWKDLQAALGATGPEWDAIKAKVGDFASALQKTTTFSDEMVVGAVQRMSTFGMSYTQAMDAVKTAIDLAAAKHMDLQSAADLVGKAFMGNTAALKKYGVDLSSIKDTSKEAGDVMKTALDQVSAALEGLSTGPTKRAESAFDQFSAAVQTLSKDDFQMLLENFAEAVPGCDALNRSFSSTGEFAKAMGDALKEGGLSAEQFRMMASYLGVTVDTTKDAFEKVTTTVSASNEKFQIFLENLAEGVPGCEVLNRSFSGTADFLEAIQKGLKEGSLSGEQFAMIARYLGVNIDAATLSAGGFDAVLGQLNKQFGGQAVAQAETYEGAQKRLANAMSDVGEKIGGIMLPALANMTEAMIPVVDWFGEGIVQVQGWITEVSKMPEVKAAADALGNAFSGLQKWFGNVASAAMEELGPALSELWDAFKEIADALEPVFEALGEIWAAFTEGEGSGNMLKDILGLVADGIKLIALGIKEVAPYIKMIAGALKEAADLIVPPIQTMMKLIGEFIGWLHDTFQGFYNWLVGKSLWQDMWGAVASLTAQMAGQILNNLAKGLLDPMKNAISNTLQTIKSMWDAAMKGLADAAKSLWNMLTGHSIWTDMLNQMVSQTQDAMSAIQGEFGQSFTGPSGIVPTVQSAAPTVTGGVAGAAAGATEMQAITLPINVYLDGQQIQTILERRLVETINRDAGRSKRG